MVNSRKGTSQFYLRMAAGATICILLGALGGAFTSNVLKRSGQSDAVGNVSEVRGARHLQSAQIDERKHAPQGQGMQTSSWHAVGQADADKQWQNTDGYAIAGAAATTDAFTATGTAAADASFSRETEAAGTRQERKDAAIAVPAYTAASEIRAVEFFEGGGLVIELPSVGYRHSKAGVAVAPQLPIAVSLAADDATLPSAVKQDVRAMAESFARDLNADGAAIDPASASYAKRWSESVARSDQQFKMKYGRVAYIRLNLLMAQEAAINAY